MRLFCFATGQSNLPHAANPDRAALGFERWREAVAQAGDSGLADFAEAVMRRVTVPSSGRSKAPRG